MDRRVIPIIVGLVAALTLGLFLWRTAGHHDTATSPHADTASVSSSPTVSETSVTASSASTSTDPETKPYSQTDQARDQWTRVVRGFGRHFTDTDHGKKHWQRLLRPYVTKAVRKQLVTVDPRNVPAGHYSRMEPLQYDDHEVVVRVDYREHWSLALYVIFDGKSWHVRAYDQWEE